MSAANPMPSGFHDTSLVGASQDGSRISLAVEYCLEDDTEASVKTYICGVEEITRGHVPIPEFKMETDYASIVMLEKKGEEIVLLLVWIGSSPRTDTTCFYQMSGADVRMLLDFE